MNTPTTVDGLRLRAVLGRALWKPPDRYGPDGWRLIRYDGTVSVLVSAASFDGVEWIHASLARHDRTIPGYSELTLLHKAAFGDGWAYQLFAPRNDHVNIHEFALHIWGRADGAPALPNFGAGGSI